MRNLKVQDVLSDFEVLKFNFFSTGVSPASNFRVPDHTGASQKVGLHLEIKISPKRFAIAGGVQVRTTAHTGMWYSCDSQFASLVAGHVIDVNPTSSLYASEVRPSGTR
jgi:hypothetical protein